MFYTPLTQQLFLEHPVDDILDLIYLVSGSGCSVTKEKNFLATHVGELSVDHKCQKPQSGSEGMAISLCDGAPLS